MILTLIAKRKEAGNAKTFIFKPQKSFTWIPGQYLIYNLDHKNPDLRGKMRFFTTSSSPFEKYPSISTRIDNIKGSSFKKALDSLKPGDTINAKGPDGDFTLENIKDKFVFIAGGIGITPFRSILKQLEHDKKDLDIILLYFSKKDVVFKKELEDLKLKRLKIEYLIDKRISEADIKKITDFKRRIFYVSGPDAMTESTENLLLKLEIKKEKLKTDYFSGY